MQNHIKFSQLTEREIPALLQIEQEQDFPWSEQLLRECLQANYRCYGITQQQEIIGFAILMLVSDQAELLNIAIRKASQGKGLGKQLLKYSLAQVIAEGVKQIFLEVRVTNFPAQQLYQQFGFQKVGRRENYYETKQGSEDADVYCLEVVYPSLHGHLPGESY